LDYSKLVPLVRAQVGPLLQSVDDCQSAIYGFFVFKRDK
jgi:hypothetical protein